MKIKVLAVLMVAVFALSGCTGLLTAGKGIIKNEKTEEKTGSIQAEGTVEEKEIMNSKVSDLLEGMDRDARREVNIFLSNFSEAYYNPGSGVYASEAEEKIAFAFTHAKINADSMIFYEGSNMGISATDTDAILYRFFGSTVPHETPSGSREWTYRDGKFLMQAASGESYLYFSIATAMTKRSDGNYDVSFTIHSDSSALGGGVITNKNVYALSEQEAGAYPIEGEGTAVLKPKQHNGKASYELVSYTISYNG